MPKLSSSRQDTVKVLFLDNLFVPFSFQIYHSIGKKLIYIVYYPQKNVISYMSQNETWTTCFTVFSLQSKDVN